MCENNISWKIENYKYLKSKTVMCKEYIKKIKEFF